MADLNALIAQGYQFQAPPDPFAQYARMQQLDQGEQANQLNRMKMQEYQRGMDETNALRRLDPTSATYLEEIKRINPKMGFEFAKSQADAKNAATEGQIKSTELLTKKLAMLPDAYRMADTPEAYLQLHESIHADPVVGPYLKSVGATPEKGRAAIQQAVETGKFDELRRGSMQSVSQLLESMKPLVVGASSSVYNPKTKTYTQAPSAPAAPTDVKKLIMERDALPPGSPNRAIYDQQIKDLGATAQAARDRLAFDQQKFTWEKANPGYNLVQNGDGDYFAVNKQNNQMTPLMVASGAAAPAGGGQDARGTVGVTDGGRPMVPFTGKTAGATTEGERKAATLLQRLQFSQSQLTQALSDDPDAAKPGVFASAVAKLSTPLANTLTPEARQRVESAQLDMLDAALTLGTGAAYTREQLEGYRSAYFPSIGDGPNQVKDKKARLENVISAAQIAAGKAGKLVPNAPAIIPAAVTDNRAAADKILGVP